MWKGASLRMLLQNGLIAAQRGLVIMGRAEGMDISPLELPAGRKP